MQAGVYSIRVENDSGAATDHHGIIDKGIVPIPKSGLRTIQFFVVIFVGVQEDAHERNFDS